MGAGLKPAPTKLFRRVRCALTAACLVLLPITAHAELAALDDQGLAGVTGQDGISLQFVGFGIDGDARFTYREPPGAGGSLWVEKLKITTVDDTARLFSDPLLIDVIDGGGAADYINIQFPQNPDSIAKSTWSFDLGVNADGSGDWNLGAVVLRDVVQHGTRVRITSPPAGEGFALDLSTRLDIGNILIRPRGRGDPHAATLDTVAEQLNISGVHLAGSNLVTSAPDPGSPFRLGDIFTQPLIIRSIQEGGIPYLNVHMDWPTGAAVAPIGSVVIDNVTFNSDITGVSNFGSSQIGLVQVQYLDLRFANTP